MIITCYAGNYEDVIGLDKAFHIHRTSQDAIELDRAFHMHHSILTIIQIA